MPDLLTSLRPPRLDAPPSDPRPGEVYYNTVDRTLYWCNEAGWVAATRGVAVFTGPDPPDGAQDGDLWIPGTAINQLIDGDWVTLAPLPPYTWADLI